MNTKKLFSFSLLMALALSMSLFAANAPQHVGELNIPLTIIADVILVAFCYAVTYISAGKIKAISVTELMTE